MTDAMIREQAITGEAALPASLASDFEVVTEACVKNKGLIMGCISNLPAPILSILKSLAHLMLTPLHIIAGLKLDAIYNGLNNFANSPQPTAPTALSSDTAPNSVQ